MTDRSLFESTPTQATLTLDQAGELARLRSSVAERSRAAADDLARSIREAESARQLAAGGPAEAELVATLNLLRNAQYALRLAAARATPNP